MQVEQVKNRLDYLDQLADQTRKGIANHTNYFGALSEFRSAGLSLIEKLFSETSLYYKEYDSCLSRASIQTTNAITALSKGQGILRAIRTEIEAGWLTTVKGLISAEIFSDFLEMASHLLEQGYKAPAAVMIGGVLEEHLRQLCDKNNIATFTLKDSRQIPKKADSLNTELAAANVYGKLEQKSVVAWLDLRNKAAHGLYDEFRKEQVEIMEMGVTDFVRRVKP